MLTLILFSFILYYFLSVYYFETLKGKNKKMFLVLTFAVVAVIIGIRNPQSWSDTGVYYMEFMENVKPLSDTSSYDGPQHYGEMGFYYIGVLCKTFSNSPTFYFIVVSALSMLFLYFGIKKYSIFPFIALYVYLGRFIGRNTIQIRSAIAIAIVIWGTIYVTKRQLWRYLLVVYIASRFHTSAYLAFPLYFMGYVNIKKWHIYVGILLSLLIALVYGGTIHDILSQSDLANEWARSYVQEDSEKAYSNDLTNPVIWYQIAILLMWTFFENKLSSLTEHYYTIRNAYFYSTILLIVLYQFAILAGRTSTVFATYEMVMIPLFPLLLPKGGRNIAYLGIGIFYVAFMFMNIRNYV